MMMICRWITLTSQHLWQNHHIKPYFCQIRAWKKSVVRPVFQICLLYTSHTRDRQFEPIKLHYSKNVRSTWLSKFVIVCVFTSKNCGSPGFQTILKTARTTLFFHALIWQKCCFIWKFRQWCCDVRLSLPAYHHLIFCWLYFQFFRGK